MKIDHPLTDVELHDLLSRTFDGVVQAAHPPVDPAVATTTPVADAAYAHDEAIRQARGEHQVAQSRHRQACQHLNDAGLRHRRDARRQLAVAEDRLTAATHTLRASETAAEPHQRRLADSVTDLRQHEGVSRAAEQLDRWANRHGRHQQLHSIDAALDTWQQWATGNHVTTSRLTQAVRTLESDVSVLAAPSYRALAQAVRNWTVDNGIDLGVSDPPLRPPVTVRHGLSIGLGR